MEHSLILSKLYLFAGVMLAVSLLVIGAIMLDLWDGVHTAQILKQRVHSHKLRVTVSKLAEYWRFIVIGFLVDCLGVLFSFYPLPFVTVLFGLGLIIVEVRSMFEHATRRKSAVTEIPDIVKAIVECVDEKDAHKLVRHICDSVNDKGAKA